MDEKSTAYNEGYMMAGIPIPHGAPNPYDPDRQRVEYLEWRRGYFDALLEDAGE